MNALDLLLGAVRAVLRLVLWAVAALLALAMVTVALVFVLSWALVSLAMGRKPVVSLRGRFQSMGRFGAGWGPNGLKAGTFWPRQSGPRQGDEAAHGRPADAPLPRRMAPPGAVVDVEARDVPPQRGGH
jgi:hypothetical protein